VLKNIVSKKIMILTYVVIIFIFVLILFGSVNIYKSGEIIKNQSNTNLIYLAKEIKQQESNIFCPNKENHECTRKIKNFVNNFKLYKTGKIYLISEDNKILFAKDYKSLQNTDVIDKNLYKFLNNEFKNGVNLKSENVELIKSSSLKKMFAVTRLNSGYILVLEVPARELYAEINKLIEFTSYSLVLAVLIVLLIAIRAYAKIKIINNELIHKEKLISMGTMAAEVAHEINNPLGYINCNIDTLKNFMEKIKTFLNYHKIGVSNVIDKKSTMIEEIEYVRNLRTELKIDFVLDSIDELIDESKDGIKRVSEIVIKLKDFSKEDNLNNKTQEDLEKIIEESLAILNNKISRDIEIIRVCEENIPPIICNKNQLEQVLINMIENACHSIEEKGAESKKITISTYKKGKNAFIEVEDNGIGMDRKETKKIFDSFYTTKINKGGTGLGLSIAYDIIVNKHNGKIIVDSKKGIGTKFIIKLPY